MNDLLFLAAILSLTFASGFFSASEIAFFSLSPLKIKSYRTSPDARKRQIANLVLQPRDLLVTVFMLNTLVNILLQNVSSHYFGNLAGWTYQVGVPLVLTLVFGEVIPKIVALQHNIGIAHASIPVIAWLQNVLAPIRRITIAVTAPISRVQFFFLRKEKEISKEELLHVLETSEEYGVLHEDEGELLEGYLRLQEAEVRELMRPREEVLFYDIREPISKLTHLFVDQECSRLPVCEGSLESVLGIMSAEDYFIHRDDISIVKQLKKPFFVPETTSAPLLLRQFEQRNEEMALVIDEYGSISGLITYEDLIEEVIGEIEDRRDVKALYTRAAHNVIIASGKLELDDLEEIFDVHLESKSGMLTVGGWLTEKLGDIPKSGTKYESNHLLFQVLTADPNRVRRVYIRKTKGKS